MSGIPAMSSVVKEPHPADAVEVNMSQGRVGSTAAPPFTPPKPTHMSRKSLPYLILTISFAMVVFRLGIVDFYRIGNAHYEELKVNLRPAWVPFRWLGSRGVDVADIQWYYFILALPPTFPILLLFIVLSRVLKRVSAPVVMPYGAPSSSAGMWQEVGSRPSHQQQQLLAAEDRVAGLKDSTVIVVDGGGGGSSGARRGSASGSPTSSYVGRNLTLVYVTHAVFGCIIAASITGPGFLFGLALMLVNYFCIAQLRRRCSFTVCMTVMWTVHISTLFVNYYADGYRFAWFGLSFLDNLFPALLRWNVHYNMTVLRMIAFNNDYWEAYAGGEERREKAWSKHDRTCIQCAVLRDENRTIAPTTPQGEVLRCYKCRTECPRPLCEYNLLSYLAYMFYPPLYVAGPMSSFNGYISHLHYPTRAVCGRALVRYGLRFAANAFALAAMMHYTWITTLLYTKPAAAAIAATTGGVAAAAAATTTTTTAAVAALGAITTTTTTSTTTTAAVVAAAAAAEGQQNMITSTQLPLSVFQQLDYVSKAKLLFMTLAFLWMKFNVFWKFFRFFALLDGVDPPEDMKRCFANTVNIQGFWRDWHASFNLWIVRYMYIPMGGRQRIAFSIFPIFFFIAVWHDIELRLLYWALFMCVFMVPEVAVTSIFASKKNATVARIKRRTRLYWFLRVSGACFNMLLLIIVNLIGFSIGMSGAKSSISDLLSQLSPAFAVITVVLFFSAATIAIQDRDQEAYDQQVMRLKYNLQTR